ncbi:hydroxymethylbilane synthase [Candidatus Marinamargulisbacteria bacterium SCGC AG-343-D04]|nr:hydroxymethylbilane synthase [Candidatus Marinamargulisbacteria bacterium SCGC AG-343-D04]
MQIKIGTRGSKLALRQATIVLEKIKEIMPDSDPVITIIQSEGDLKADTPLAELGGKGVFIKTLEDALVQQKIDMAVHSLKDVTTEIAEGTELAAFLDPESIVDVMVCPGLQGDWTLETLPEGLAIATSSARRKALLAEYRPDIRIVDIRGNVDTRIRKCKEGLADGVMLSEVGLVRLGLEDQISCRCEVSRFIPAPGQGVMTVQARTEDQAVMELCQKLGSKIQKEISDMELCLLRELGLGCNYPLGVYTSSEDDGRVKMRVFWASLDGEMRLFKTICGAKDQIRDQISALAVEIKASYS